MIKRQLDEISESALLLFPLLKRLIKGDLNDPARAPFRNQSYQVLRILERKGPLPMSAIGKRLIIAKQNMTPLIDKLMRDGLVERRNDTSDRRVINIVITERGTKFLEESRTALKRIIKGNLSELGREDIQLLDSAFQTIKAVVSKLETPDRGTLD
jgi:MarR family transcriptional regulator, 2-MHQ and catechol-resistance regulon repressor